MDLDKSASARADFIQATEAGELHSLFARKIQSLVDENEARQKESPPRPPLGIAEIEVASFLHGFMMVLFVSTDAALWPPGSLRRLVGRFWLAADAESLSDYQEAAIASLRNGSSLRHVKMSLAGGMSGRVMVFVGAERIVERTVE